jgi:hypothetical protein
VTTPVAWTGIDLEALVSSLQERGLDARMGDEEAEPVIEVSSAETAADDVVAQVESVLVKLDLPLVTEKGDGQVYIRPPAA